MKKKSAVFSAITFLSSILEKNVLTLNSQGRSGLPCEFDADLW